MRARRSDWWPTERPLSLVLSRGSDPERENFQCESSYQVFACITPVTVPLNKTSHMF